MKPATSPLTTDELDLRPVPLKAEQASCAATSPATAG